MGPPVFGAVAKLAPNEESQAGIRRGPEENLHRRNNIRKRTPRAEFGDIAQLGERQLCKLEVTGSIPVISTEK